MKELRDLFYTFVLVELLLVVGAIMAGPGFILVTMLALAVLDIVLAGVIAFSE